MKSKVLETREVFQLEKFWLEKQTCFKIELDPLLLKKLVCALTPNLLSNSQKENGTNEAQGVEIWGLYTCMEEKGRPKVTQILIRKSIVQYSTMYLHSH